MPSKIEQGLGKVSQSAQARLKGVTGSTYTAANIKVGNAGGGSSKAGQLAESLGRFMDTATKAGHYYVDVQEKKAQQNVKKIMASMSPQVIQNARADGTILAHDDPYTKAALNRSLAAQESDAVYTQISKNMNAGLYSSKSEMNEALTSALKAANVDMRVAYGVDGTDEDWETGWASDIESKNIAMHQQLDGILDQKSQNLAMATNKTRNGQLIADEAMGTDDWISAWRNNFDSASHEGLLRDSTQKKAVLGHMVSGLVSSAKGAERLASLGEQTVDIDGAAMSVREFLGEDQWQNAVAKAEKSKFDLDWKTQKAFTSDLYAAATHEDVTLGIESAEGMLKTLEEDTNPSPQTNAKKQEVLSTILKLKDRMRTETAAVKKRQASEDQQNVRISELRKKYQSYLDGDITSTRWQDMPQNDATGKYTAQDETELANMVFNEIDENPNLTEDLKIERKLQWIKASPKESSFRQIFGSVITDSSAEINAAILSQDPEADLSKTHRLNDMYQKNKSMMMMLYPENAETFAKLDALAAQGIKPELLFKAEAQRARIKADPQLQREHEADWTAIRNNSKFTNLKYLGASASAGARTIYDAVTFAGGDSTRAAQAVSNYLEENFVTFKDELSSDGGIMGQIPKATFMVGNDPSSVDVSVNSMKEAVAAQVASLPFVDTAGLNYEVERNGTVWVSDPTGSVSMPFTADFFKASNELVKRQAAPKVAPKASTDAGVKTLKKNQARAQSLGKGKLDTVAPDDERSAKNKSSIWNR